MTVWIPRHALDALRRSRWPRSRPVNVGQRGTTGIVETVSTSISARPACAGSSISRSQSMTPYSLLRGGYALSVDARPKRYGSLSIIGIATDWFAEFSAQSAIGHYPGFKMIRFGSKPLQTTSLNPPRLMCWGIVMGSKEQLNDGNGNAD